jgi:hypothetical protein
VADLVAELLEEDRLGLRGAQAGDPLELDDLALAQLLDLVQPHFQGSLACSELFELGVDRLLPVQEPLLELDDVGSRLSAWSCPGDPASPVGSASAG